MIATLFGFKGGIKPQSNKEPSAEVPIAPAPLPPQFVVPLRQSSGAAASLRVRAGEAVLKGQLIGAAEGAFSSAVHAPTSGTVRAIEPRPVPHPSGLPAPCVIIDADGDDRWIGHDPVAWQDADPEALRARLRDAGVVGLGGATFPSHVKLRPGQAGQIAQLVINGAECEPWITADDRLMRERAEGILRGARIMRHIVGARRILVGVEDNKPQAIAALRAAARALGGEEPAIVPVPTRYPAGGEKQLIRVLTGIEIPYGRFGAEFGVQCFNVGTAYAVHRAIEHGEPLVARVVTLTGNVAHPLNLEARIGTPIDFLLPLAAPHADTDRYLMGGPMMGFALPSPASPVVKATNCIIAASPRLFPAPPPELPCIRCGACARACPAELQPMELYWFARARNFGKTQEYHVFDCIECGACAYVCPSSIRLVDYFRFAKSSIRTRERDKAAADGARARFEFRSLRAEREQREKAERLAARTAAGRQAAAPDSAGVPAAPAPADPAAAAKKALIAAALERARSQKAAVQPRNTDNLAPDKRAEIAEIEARRNSLREMAKTPPEEPV